MATVLVVDDSAMDRRIAGRLLERNSDWKVLYAQDGHEALAQIDQHLPDVVVTDIQMPNVDGLELVTSIRTRYPVVPVILMTAHGTESLAVQALQQGAASYVPKNQLVHDLVETVERVLVAAHEERGQSRLMGRLTKIEATFDLENDLTMIPALVSYLQQIIVSVRFCDETNRLRVGVALEEALLNAYYHGNLEISSSLREDDHGAYYELAKSRSKQLPYRDRRIHVHAIFSADETVYVITDDGPGFDPRMLPDATDTANLERPCGRGVLLMKTFMDEVRFNEQGNQVTLIKRRPADQNSTRTREAS